MSGESERSTTTELKKPDSNELEKVKMLLDYTKFHIGLYISLFAAIVAFLSSELGPSPGSWLSYGFFGGVVLFTLAGMCGGVIGSYAVGYDSYSDLMKNEDKKIGPSLFKWVKATGDTWATSEHRFFWLGVLVVLVSFGLFLYKGRGSNDEEAANKVITRLVHMWNNQEFNAASKLWTADGVIQNLSERPVFGREEIEKALNAAYKQIKAPIENNEPIVRKVRSDLEIVSGTLKSTTSQQSSTTPQEETFTVVLAKTKEQWEIVLWVRGP